MRCELSRTAGWRPVALWAGLVGAGLGGCAGDRHGWTEALTGVEQPLDDAVVDAAPDLGRLDAQADPLCEDGETQPCARDCFAGVETCSAGEWVGCDARARSDEICDGVDDDCDGATDEGLQAGCCVAGLTDRAPCNGCPPGVEIPAGWVCMPGAAPDEPALLVSAAEVTHERWHTALDESLAEGVDGRQPVEAISFFEAAAWCNAASQADGWSPCYRSGLDPLRFADLDDARAVRLDPTCDGYRLPTGEEWVRAVRAGHAGPAPGVPAGAVDWTAGDCAPLLDPHAWYTCTARGRVQPVGGSEARAPNALGLVDGIGNVWEWVHGGDPETPVEPGAVGDLRGCSAEDRAERCRYDTVLRERNTLRVPRAGLRPVRRPAIPTEPTED